MRRQGQTVNCLAGKAGVLLEGNAVEGNAVEGNAVEGNAGPLGCVAAVSCDCASDPDRSIACEQPVRGASRTAVEPSGKRAALSTASSDDLVDCVLNDPACACLFQSRYNLAYDRLFHNCVHVDPVRIGQRRDRWFLQSRK